MNSRTGSQHWEDSWGRKLQEAFERYQAATARYRDLLEAEPDGRIEGPDDPLAHARRMEAQALFEYRVLLKVVSELDLRHGETKSGDDGEPGSHFNCRRQ